MGNLKQKWAAEEEALLAEIARHGPGKWKYILRDPEFATFLVNRSNIDLKDKWQNLSVSGPSSKDKLRLPKECYIEKGQEVLPNFLRLLGLRLRRLVSHRKLEKVQNNYRINRDTTLETKPTTPKQKDMSLRPIQAPLVFPSHETIQEAAMAAAYKVAETENKSFLASEAVKEAERV